MYFARVQHQYLIALVGLSVASCAADVVVSAPVVRPVRYERVVATSATRVLTFAGVARAGLESSLSFRVSGRVDAVAVKVGDVVRPGQLLATIDAGDYELQVREADAMLRQVEAQARNADADLGRTRSLFENGNASRADFDGARALAESARAQVESVEKRRELAVRQVDYTRLESSVVGAVAAVRLEVNENVAAGQPVVNLASQLNAEVAVAIPESLITQVQEGWLATVTFDAIPDKTFSGRVVEVGIAPTEFATTFQVTLRLTSPAPEVRPGMAAAVEFDFSADGGEDIRILVPSVAVGEDRDGRFVYVVQPGSGGLGTVHRRAVTVAGFAVDDLVIPEGLADGDLVVTAGVSKLEEGLEVRLSTSQENDR